MDGYCVRHTVLHDAVVRPSLDRHVHGGHVEIPEKDLNEGSEKTHQKLRKAAKAKNKRRIAGGKV